MQNVTEELKIQIRADAEIAIREFRKLTGEIHKVDLQRFGRDSKVTAQQVDQLGGSLQSATVDLRGVSAELVDLRQRSQQADRETLQMRQTMAALNQTNAELRASIIGVDAAEAKRIRTLVGSNNAQKALLSSKIEHIAVQKRSISLSERELRGTLGLGKGFGQTAKSAGLLSGALGKAGLYGAATLAVGTIGRLGAIALQSAGEMNDLMRGLVFTTGSVEAANKRFQELNELAKFPGLDRKTLITYTAIMQNMGIAAADVDKIFLGLSRGITTFGGTMHDVSGSALQLVQAFDKGKISAQDFRPILERTRGSFLSTAKEVHQFTGGIEEMRKAHEASGKTLQDFLLPVFERMAETLPGAEVESYTNLMGNLTDASGNLAAAIGQKLLPMFKFVTGDMIEGIERLADWINGTEDQRTAFEKLHDTFVNHTAHLVNLKERYQELKDKGIDPTSARMEQYQRRIDNLERAITELLPKLRQEEESLKAIKAATEEDTKAKKDATAAVEVAQKKVGDYTETIKELTKHIKDYEAHAKQIASFDTFWNVAAKGADTYNDALKSILPIVNDLKSDHEALFGSIQRDIDAILPDLNEIIDAYANIAIMERPTITDLSGRRTPGDFTQSGAFRGGLVGPNAVERRSHLQSPIAGRSGQNLTIADLGLTPKVREFEQVSDISIDVLDQFNVSVPDATDAVKEVEKELRTTQQNIAMMGSVIDSVIGELSTFDGNIGTLATKIGEFDIAGLASGNPVSIATLPFQIYDAFTFDQRQAEARLPELHRKNQADYHAGKMGIPPDLLETGRAALDRAFQALISSGFEAVESELAALNPVIGTTSLDEVATMPDRILKVIQSYTNHLLTGLQEELEQAQFNLTFAKQTGGDVQQALNDVIDANTALYQKQIDSYNLQRQATGRMIGNIEELNRTLNTLSNQARLQLEPLQSSNRYNLYQELKNRPQSTSRQERESVAADMYGAEAYQVEVKAAEKLLQTYGTATGEFSANLQRMSEKNNEILDTSRNFIKAAIDAYEGFNAQLASYVTPEEFRDPEVERLIESATPRLPSQFENDPIVRSSQAQGHRQQFSNEIREDLSSQLGSSIEGLLRSTLGDAVNRLIPLTGLDGLDFLGIRGNPAGWSQDRFTSEIEARLPGAIERLAGGTQLGMADKNAFELSQSLNALSEKFDDSTVTEAYEKLINPLEVLELSVKELNMPVTELDSNIQALTEPVTQLDTSINELVAPLDALMSPLDTLRESVESLRAEFASFKSRPIHANINVEVPIGSQLIRAVTRAQIEGVHNGTNWN